MLRLFERPRAGSRDSRNGVSGGGARGNVPQLGATSSSPAARSRREHHDQAPLSPPARAARLDFEPAPPSRRAHLALQHEEGTRAESARGTARAARRFDHLEKRLALAAHRASPSGARPLVMRGLLVAVPRDDARPSRRDPVTFARSCSRSLTFSRIRAARTFAPREGVLSRRWSGRRRTRKCPRSLAAMRMSTTGRVTGRTKIPMPSATSRATPAL